MGPREGTFLRFTNMDEVVGRALVQRLTLMWRLPLAFATTAELRATRSDVRDTTDDAAPDIASTPGYLWAWYRYETAAEDTNVVRPSDVPADKPGRWVRQVWSPMAAENQRRYLTHVEFCDLRIDVAELMDRCRGRTPALFVSPAGDVPQSRSQTMAIHQVALEFRLRVLTQDYRGGVTARFSGEPADASAAPGASRIIGDLREYLIGDNRLGNLPGVLKITLGAHKPELSKARERLLCDGLDITVQCAVDSPNESCDLRYPWQIWQDLQNQAGASAFGRSLVGGPT